MTIGALRRKAVIAISAAAVFCRNVLRQLAVFSALHVEEERDLARVPFRAAVDSVSMQAGEITSQSVDEAVLLQHVSLGASIR
jgi:hypothetical protein